MRDPKTAMFKQEILELPEYKKHKDFLNEIMDGKHAYSLAEVDRALVDYCRQRVGKK